MENLGFTPEADFCSATGCSETRVQILSGSRNLTNESNGLIFVLKCREIITFYNTLKK